MDKELRAFRSTDITLAKSIRSESMVKVRDFSAMNPSSIASCVATLSDKGTRGCVVMLELAIVLDDPTAWKIPGTVAPKQRHN